MQTKMNEKLSNSNSVETNTDNDCPNAVKRNPIAERIPGFGIYMTLLSQLCLSLMALIVRLLTEMPSIQILVIESAIGFVVFALIATYRQQPLFGDNTHRLLLLSRVVLGTVVVVVYYMALRYLPLPDITTLGSLTCIMTLILAYIILKEPLTVIKIIITMTSLVGVIVISKPDFLFGARTDTVYTNRTVGIVLITISSIGSALSNVCLRLLKTTSTVIINLWLNLSIVITGTVMLFSMEDWSLPNSPWHWLLLICSGIFSINYCWFYTLSFRYESAGPLAMVKPFGIVLSFLWEALLLSGAIEWTTILGAVIITVCVMIIALIKWSEEKPEVFKRFNGWIKI